MAVSALKKDKFLMLITVLAAAFLYTTCSFTDLFLVSFGISGEGGIDGAGYKMYLGQTITLKTSGNLDNNVIQWTPVPAGIVTVENGVVKPTGKCVGKVTITASFVGVTETYVVEVIPFDDIAGAASYLDNLGLGSGASKDNPVFLSMKIELGDGNSGSGMLNLLTMIGTEGKYVDLDLTECSITVSETGIFTGSGNVEVVSFQPYVVILRLPKEGDCILKEFNGDADADEGYINLTRIEGKRVIKIGEYAFSGCEALEEICFPALTSIEGNAFLGCANILKVTIGRDATIGDATLNINGFTSAYETVYNKQAGTYARSSSDLSGTEDWKLVD